MESVKRKFHVEVSSLVTSDKGGWINVGDLPEKTSEKEVKKMFSKFGKVLRVTVNTNLGFASVKMDSCENAQNAIKELNGIILHGKRVRLNLMAAESPTTSGSSQKDNCSSQGRAVKVENLSPVVTNELLKKAFSHFGPVEKAVVIVDNKGRSTTRGTVDYVSYIDAEKAVKQIEEGCFLLTASPKPVSATLMEAEDSNYGLTDAKIRKTPTFYKEIKVGPRMAVRGTFEEECARTWKVRYQVERQQRENFEEEMRAKRVVLESKIEVLRTEESGRSPEEQEARKRVRMVTQNIEISQKEIGEPPAKRERRESMKSPKNRCKDKIDQLLVVLELAMAPRNNCTDGNRRQRIAHVRELLRALVNKICYCLTVVYDLEMKEIDPFNLDDIDTLLGGMGLTALDLNQKNLKEKVDICRGKMKEIQLYMATKLEKRAKLTSQQLNEDVRVRETIDQLLTFDESIHWKKQETGRINILLEKMITIIKMCVKNLADKLKTSKDAKYLNTSIFVQLIDLELPSLKDIRAGKSHVIKRALSQFTDEMTAFLCQRFLVKRSDFDEQSACMKEFYLTKCFGEFCMKMCAIFKGCDHRSRKRFLTTILQKASTQNSVLPLIDERGGAFGENHRQFSRDAVIKATEFYLRDEYSTQMAHMTDNYISHILEISVQKRMLLSTIGELYTEFKREHAELRMGRSRFYSLRPDWVELESSTGGKPEASSAEKVCERCQNIKLKTHAIPGRPHYRDLLRAMVCDFNNHSCIFDNDSNNGRLCTACPGVPAMESLLKSLNFTTDIVNFQQWLPGRRLVSVDEHRDEFIATFAAELFGFKEHFVIAKHQSDYMRQLKLNLPDNEVVAVFDFAQNYPFNCQDDAGGGSGEEATVHPVVVYHRDSVTHDVTPRRYCFLSDAKAHSTNAVHAFTSVLLKDIKTLIPNIEKVHYFSDDASAYKDFKHLSNLIHHEQDFQIGADWNFYPAGHGKNCPDAVSGAVKRAVRKESLRRKDGGDEEGGPIVTVEAMHRFLSAIQRDIDVNVFLVTEEEIRQDSEKFGLKKRFQEVKRFTGMHKLYSFKMVNSRMVYRKVSGMT